MRCRFHLLPQQLALFLLVMAGCSDSSTEPNIDPEPTFDIVVHFPEDEAIATREEPTTRLQMVGVQFDTGESTLTDGSKAVLDRFRTVFENLPGARYEIGAHTDSRGNSDYNLDLTQRRADAVRDYFVDELEGPAVAITAVGYGEEQPIDNNATVNGRNANNRVEILVHDSTGARVFQLTLAADELVVRQDCDASTSSPEAAAGDFYISASMIKWSGGDQTVIDATEDILVRANDGETMTLGIAASGRYIAEPDTRVMAVVRIYEADPAGDRDFNESSFQHFVWDEARGCWTYLNRDDCLGASGDIAEQTISVYEGRSGAPCSLDLHLSLRAEVVSP